MRFPLLWVASALAAGVFLHGAVTLSFAVVFSAAALFFLMALAFCRNNLLRFGWWCSLAAWVLLGLACSALQVAALPRTHVTRLFDQGRVTAKDTLRWSGRLRSDPLQMPGSLRYEIQLEQVELGGQPLAVNGGLRITYFRDPSQAEEEPAVRAGDPVEVLVRARPPRNFLTPGAFNARAQLARQGIHLSGTLRSLELLRPLPPRPLSLAHRAARIRGDLLAKIETLFQDRPNHAAVLRAILLGDYNFIDHELAETFQKTSAYHVLVISGLHVAALATFVFWLGRRMRFGLAATSLFTLTTLAAFAAIVENRPPILRAVLMMVFILASGLLFRKAHLLNTVGAAGLAILVLQPDALLDSSFQLSFLAGLMIGALGLPLVDRTSASCRGALRHLGDVTRDAGHAPRVAQFRLDLRAFHAWTAAQMPRPLARFAERLVTAPILTALWTWDVMVISTVIQIGMLPVLAHYFHRISLAGPIANVPAALLSAALIPLGLAALVAGSVWNAAGALLALATSCATELLLRSVAWFAQWDHLSYRIPGPPVWLLWACFAALAVLASLVHSSIQRNRRAALWTAAVCAAIPAFAVATYPFPPNLQNGRMEATVLDVGQGDSIFLSFPQGQTMLVDGGGQFGTARARGFRSNPDLGEQVVSPYLWSRGVKRIDVVALSHAHQDHLEGLISVLENFPVRELWLGREIRSEPFARLLQKAAEHGVRVLYRRRGDVFQMGPATGLVLWPEELPATENAGNNDSLVLRLTFGERTFLLPGDIETDVERELFERDDPLSADFLKVPHHGSRTSTTANFALAVLPRVTVMSFSEANPFGHPHPKVIETLGAIGAEAYRTDRDGAVTISTDGKSLKVSAYSHGKKP